MVSNEPTETAEEAAQCGSIRGPSQALESARRAAEGPVRAGLSEEELELYLESWARWDRVKHGIGECDSLERRWKSPQEWHEPGAVQIPRGPIDRTKAIAVNSAWIDMPEPYKSVLRDWYVYRRNPRITCRRLAISFMAHEEYVRRSRLMIRNRLERALAKPQALFG